MKSAYFREGRHYSLAQLEFLFSSDKEKTKKNIGTLKRYNLFKTVRKDKPEYSELSDQDSVIGEIPDDSSDFSYVFSFVGVILLDDLVLFCYPKYIDNDEKPFEKLKTVIKVIEKYNQKEQLIHLYNGEDESKQFNRLAISLHILNDYFENGLYSNQQEVVELNGEGEILWDKTINETYAFIKNNTPYYLDVYTQDNTQNDFDFIRRLHAAIISQCSRDLNHDRLLDLFGLAEAELTDETLEDFGDVDYIKYRLEKEIKNQFVTRKQNLLKTLYTFISEQSSNQSDASFSLYGTNVFYLVWETACGEMFENMKSETLKKLAERKLISLNEHSDGKSSISDYIEIPEWIVNGQPVSYQGDLIPDVVTLRKENTGNTAMYILDGKYYLLSVSDGKLYGNPGIQDVVKQYVYNASLKSFIDTFQIGEVANAFLIPALESESAENQNYGEVPYWTVQHSGFNELPPIQVIKLQAQKVWDYYLGVQTDNALVFNLIQKSPTKNYLYHNGNDNSIIQINDSKKHILVGFMRKNYFDHVYKNLQSLKNKFIFYFYATGIEKESKQFTRYPMHPYIDSCTEIILFTEDRTRFLRGKVALTQTGRCKIDEVTEKSLERELNSLPAKFVKAASNAKTYYKVTVEQAKISDKPYESISTYFELKSKIKENGVNDVLFRTSPKVIDV